jgi:hypothetical protein
VADTATTDLTAASDLELDAALLIGYRQHRDASRSGDEPAKAECHNAIVAILREQARRRDDWLKTKATARPA